MKKFVSLIVLLVFIFSFQSCHEDSILNTDEISIDLKSQSAIEKEKKEYDKNLRKIAKALAKSMNDKSLRKLLKKEALYQVDGDYDIIWKDFKHSSFQNSKGKTDVKEFIAENVEDSGKSKQKKVEELEDFGNKYKQLQIAIPVNCEDWDIENYVPLVTYIPADFEDNWEEVEAFDSKGKPVKLSLKNEPNVPVVVVGLNERSDENGNIKSGYSKAAIIGGDEPPPAPTGLSASTVASGIHLSWDPVYNNNILGYKVKRKGPNDSSFSYIAGGDILGEGNTVFTDLSVNANLTYSYVVVSYNIFGIESLYSNVASAMAPNLPSPVVTFDAMNYAQSTVYLYWQNDNTQYIESTKIFRAIKQSNPSFSLLETFTNNESDYFDMNLTPGYIYHYKILNETPIGISGVKYDFVQVPYRDINQYSNVYIKQISFTDWSLESWIAGKPEFYVTVNNVNSNKDIYPVQENINCEFSSRTDIQTFSGKFVLAWKPGFWYDMLSFHVIEYDQPSGERDITVSTKYNVKDKEEGNLYEHSTSGTITFNNNGQNCGSGYISYYDNPESYITFPGYGVKILISETDN